ncbi:NADP-dependent malic enzyme [Candidatus Pacearchaeota archaeon]|nr:NADP-dependent malic enzyme [Candidatus Pacearchaeota archaeon]
MEIEKQSIELHKKLKGKISTHIKHNIKTKHDLSLIYTPGVGEISNIIAKDNNKAYDYTIKNNTVAIISDGSAVLGLGNIGALGALPVMEGKAQLFKQLADIDAFPICLDKQDIELTINTIKNIAPVFGGINLEDFKAPECFEIEKRLQDIGIPVMHDDQHGTAVVVLAALINAIEIKNIKKESTKIIINGAGAAGIAITKILDNYGFNDILVLDSKGIINKNRTDMNKYKHEIADLTNHKNIQGNLETALKNADTFIGVSKPNLLTKELIQLMNNNPIIFALANPIPEIMPKEAKKAGVKIIATGRSDFPNQVNNSLAFPGIFKGALEIRAKKITNNMKIAAAIALAKYTRDTIKDKDILLPSTLDLKVPKIIAEAVKKAYKEDEQD